MPTLKQLQDDDERNPQEAPANGLIADILKRAALPGAAYPLPSGLHAEARAIAETAHLRRRVEELRKALEVQQAKADADARRYFWLSTAVAFLCLVLGWFLASINAVQLVAGLLHR